MRDFVLIILAIVVIGGGYAVQAVQLYQAEGRAAALEQALATAQKDAAQWRAVAEQRAGAANAQAGLAEACLQREAVNQRDMDQIAAIMAGVKSTEGPPYSPKAAKALCAHLVRVLRGALWRPLCCTPCPVTSWAGFMKKFAVSWMTFWPLYCAKSPPGS